MQGCLRGRGDWQTSCPKGMQTAAYPPPHITDMTAKSLLVLCAVLASCVLLPCGGAHAESGADVTIAFPDADAPHAYSPDRTAGVDVATGSRVPPDGLYAVEVRYGQTSVHDAGHPVSVTLHLHDRAPGNLLPAVDGAYVVITASAAFAAVLAASRGRRCGGHACTYPPAEPGYDAGRPAVHPVPPRTSSGGLSGTETVILDSSAIVSVMKTRLGMSDGGVRYARAADYLYLNLGWVCVTKAGSREQRPAYMGRLRHLKPEYDRTFRRCERQVDHGAYAGYQSLLDDAVDRLPDDETDGWICAKMRSLQRMVSGGAGDPGLRAVLDGADLDARESRNEAENRILDTRLRTAARNLLASEVKRRDTAIAAQAAAIAGSGDAILVSDDYDIHTLLAAPLREIAPRMRVMSLRDFDAMC